MGSGTAGVVVIGDALIDEIRDHRGVRELVGGAALNVAVGLRRLGVPTTLVAMVGDDAAGDHIREYLADHRVELIASPADQGSARAVVRLSGGEPQYAFNPAARHRRIRYDERTRAAIAGAELVAVSSFPFDDSAEVGALADAVDGSRLVVDPNPRAGMLSDRAAFVRGFDAIAPRAELVKVGRDDADLLGVGDLDDFRRRLRALGARAVLATDGADGAVLDTGAGLFTAPVAELPGAVVDTVGAGDATLAATIEGLVGGPPAAGDEWRCLLDRAMAIAAATVRREGGLLRTPASLSTSGCSGPGS